MSDAAQLVDPRGEPLRKRTITYSYEGSPTLLAFANDDHNMRGLMGPFGSGKSSACAVEIVQRGLVQEPSTLDNIRHTRWAVIRNTYGQLESTTQKTLFDWFPPHYFGIYRSSKHEYVITAFRGARIEIMFLALDRPEHVQKLLSLELTGAWVNEAREVPWEVIRVLGRRCNRYPAKREGGCTWWGVFMDTNPPDTESDWYRYFEEKRPPNAAIFKQPSGLSPQAENKQHLPATYYTDMLNDLTDEQIKIYVHGQYGFETSGKAVYEGSYNDALHCSEVAEYHPNVPIIKRGWDFGLTPAVSFSQMLPSGRKIVFDELCATRAGAGAMAKAVKRYSADKYPRAVFEDVGDPAGSYPGQEREESCFQVLNEEGIDIVAGNQDLDARIESVRWGLENLIDGQPALAIHPRCTMMRRGFQGGYKHREVLSKDTLGDQRYDAKPLKNKFSHIHDALQYDCEQDFGPMVVKLDRGRTQVQAYAHDSFDPLDGEQMHRRESIIHVPGRGPVRVIAGRAIPSSETAQEYADSDWDPFA